MLKYIVTILLCILSQGFCRQRYISATLMGELGNQMFQIAATMALSYEHNMEPVFPDLLKTNYNQLNNYENIFYKLNPQRIRRKFFVYNEPFFAYKEINPVRNTLLNGHFTSEKYFLNYKEQIIDLFSPSETIQEELQQDFSDIINDPNTVSIHIRSYNKDLRITPEIHLFHPPITEDYLREAVSLFPEDSHFIVFSDDMPFAKKLIQNAFDDFEIDVTFVEDNPYHIDFYLMSLCKHNIIANSTFSWWAAYLNKNPEKIIVAPKRWFGPKLDCHNTKDLIPDGWIQL